MKLISKAINILATSKPPHYLLILKKKLKYLRAFIDDLIIISIFLLTHRKASKMLYQGWAIIFNLRPH